jgi:type II secretory pathway pseudopilin PulG
VFSVRARSQRHQAQFKIGQLETYIEQYAEENQGYPTNEQGLFALVFIPDNVGISPVLQPGGMQPGMPGGMEDPSGGIMGQGGSIGAEMLNTPQTNPTDPTGGMPSTGMTGMPSATDPTGMMGGGTMSMDGTSSGGTQPFHNPQIYTGQRRRTAPYGVSNEKALIDPWGQPYRYDNSLRYSGVNQTGTQKPAIWSAGPDKQDGTDDDVRNWDPIEAQKLILARQQQMQGGMMGNSGMMGGMGQDMMTADPTGGGMMQPNQMMPQMPNQTMPQMPNQTMPQMPNQTMPQMPNQTMPQMPQGQGTMPTPNMQTPSMPPTGM